MAETDPERWHTATKRRNHSFFALLAQLELPSMLHNARPIIFRTCELGSGSLAELETRVCIWNWLQLDAIAQDSYCRRYRSSLSKSKQWQH